MATQARISAARLARKVGTTHDGARSTVTSERGRGRGSGTSPLARSTADAPEIDGLVRVVRRRGRSAPGRSRGRRSPAAMQHDLHARLIEALQPTEAADYAIAQR